MNNAWRTLVNYRPGRLGQNTLLGATGLGIRAIIQAAYLLIVSRWLGAEGYGLFAGSVALAALATPLGNWGSALLLTQHIGQDRSRSRAMWTTALVQTGIVGSALVIVTLLISVSLLSQQLALGPLLLLAVSELLLLPASHAASSQCYALEHGGASALSVCLVPMGRTLAVLSAMASGLSATPEHAAWAHFGGTILGFAAAIALVARIDGPPAWRAYLPLRDSIRQGAPYAISNAAGTSYQEVDKILMLQLLGAAVVGPYSVAFRVASLFVLPVSALISATLPRLIAECATGSQQRTYRAVLLSALSYGCLAGLAMLVVSPFVPRLFGPDYEDAAQYLLVLAPWPMLFALRQCLAAKLTAAHRQYARSMVEVAGLLLTVLLNLILLCRWGANSSALALLVTEAVTSLILLAIKNRRE
ncbi:lipopolysaccharide biosynthesis protein [Xenophilus sp. Marseille-Q4582]|uniref:lipopolysaccharide biosynthesis protein n=1 Tax=Xenophilus sp. Marseille-Q4582 TaxID=2866600 RepID=UPI001CE45517|nr:lipopolysaccharide biosynthesis protein [Xenophilus sp. Marseille-Q4582]